MKVVRDVGLDNRIALEEGLGIMQNQTTPTSFTSSVQINVNANNQIASTGVKGFFATTAHNAPEYFIFLLKMTLMIGIMLFIPALILGVKFR